MKKFISISFLKFIIEWFFVLIFLRIFPIDQSMVVHSLFPLVLRWKLFECWELPCFECAILGHIFVPSHVHLKVELRLIWLPLVSSLLYQVLIGASITSVIEVDAHGSQVALSWLSSLEDASELVVEVGLVGLSWVEAGLSGGLLGGECESTVLRGLNIGVPGEAR